MSQYRAPLQEMLFTMNELAGLPALAQLPGFEEASPDTVAAILEEAGKFATDVLDPLNAVGDREGARLRDDGTVATPPGFKDAYRQFCELGWNGLAKAPEYGGQGMPHLVAAAIDEMWNAANMAFELCPMLTGGAIEAIEMNGSDALKKTYLPKMVSGRVDRHDEPHGAAGRVRPRGRAHEGGAAGGRQLQALRQQDLHHLWRARLHGQHRAPRAGPHAGCAAGRQGHLALRRAEVHRRRRRRARRPQRRALRVARAQARHPRESHRRARIRRRRRRGRLSWWARRTAASSTCS